MKRLLIVVGFVLFLCPSIAMAYVLNGLDYNGGYGFGSWMTYNEIVENLKGTNKRLATRTELEALFVHFNFIVDGSTTNYDDFIEFERIFDCTYSTGYEDYNSQFIDGIYQIESEGSGIPLALVNGYYSFENSSIITRFRTSSYLPSDDVVFDFGTAAWTVAPVPAVPEPCTIFLLGFGLIVIAGLRKKLDLCG